MKYRVNNREGEKQRNSISINRVSYVKALWKSVAAFRIVSYEYRFIVNIAILFWG